MTIDELPRGVVQAVASQSVQNFGQHQHSEESAKADGEAQKLESRSITGVSLGYESGHECLDGQLHGTERTRWKTEIHIVCNLTAGPGRPRPLVSPLLR